MLHLNRISVPIPIVPFPIRNYRPQTKFAKVMFLHVSVILSRGAYVVGGMCGKGDVHGGGHAW